MTQERNKIRAGHDLAVGAILIVASAFLGASGFIGIRVIDHGEALSRIEADVSALSNQITSLDRRIARMGAIERAGR